MSEASHVERVAPKCRLNRLIMLLGAYYVFLMLTQTCHCIVAKRPIGTRTFKAAFTFELDIECISVKNLYCDVLGILDKTITIHYREDGGSWSSNARHEFPCEDFVNYDCTATSGVCLGSFDEVPVDPIFPTTTPDPKTTSSTSSSTTSTTPSPVPPPTPGVCNPIVHMFSTIIRNSIPEYGRTGYNYTNVLRNHICDNTPGELKMVCR